MGDNLSFFYVVDEMNILLFRRAVMTHAYLLHYFCTN